MVLCEEMGKGYWKEYNIIMVNCFDNFRKNDSSDYHKISYFYNCGKISRVSKWKKGKETKILKQFSGGSDGIQK